MQTPTHACTSCGTCTHSLSFVLCCRYDPMKRPTAAEALRHPYFQVGGGIPASIMQTYVLACAEEERNRDSDNNRGRGKETENRHRRKGVTETQRARHALRAVTRSLKRASGASSARPKARMATRPRPRTERVRRPTRPHCRPAPWHDRRLCALSLPQRRRCRKAMLRACVAHPPPPPRQWLRPRGRWTEQRPRAAHPLPPPWRPSRLGSTTRHGTTRSGGWAPPATASSERQRKAPHCRAEAAVPLRRCRLCLAAALAWPADTSRR